MTGAVAGIMAEIIAGAGKFRNNKRNILSYVVFSQNLFGGFLPIWMLFVLIVGTIIFAWLTA